MSVTQNLELRNQCESFCNKSIDLLKSFLDFTNQSSIEKIIFLSHQEKKFSQFPEYQVIIKLMKEDPVISKQLDVLVGTHRSGRRVDAQSILFNFVNASLTDYFKSKKFDKNSFDVLYEDFESFFYCDAIPTIHKIFIGSFKSEQPVIIDKNLLIRPLNIEERKHFDDSLMFWNFK